MRRLWRGFRCWWFRRFQFRPDRFYGNWAITAEPLDLAAVAIVMERDAAAHIPAEHMGRVSYFTEAPAPGSCDPLHPFPLCGWKYVPEKKDR
jgi:hypothetical protein